MPDPVIHNDILDPDEQVYQRQLRDYELYIRKREIELRHRSPRTKIKRLKNPRITVGELKDTFVPPPKKYTTTARGPRKHQYQ